MKLNNRKTISDDLIKYDCFAKEHDFIEITEWTNEEGIDINLTDDSGSRTISVTYAELEAINYLTMALKYEKVEK